MANEQDQDRSANSSGCNEDQKTASFRSGGGLFEIRVKGHLNPNWSDWLEGLEMRLLDNGEMILVGPVVDQAALMGILNKLSRLNLALLSVNEVKSKERSEEK
jgi:hypothetical protein